LHFRPAESPVDPVEPLDEPPAEIANAAVSPSAATPTPARIPPDEAPVDQSSTPWRVFDAPASSPAQTDGVSGSSGSPAPGLPNQRIAVAGIAGAIAIGAVAVLLAIGGTGAATIDGPEESLSVKQTGKAGVGSGDLVVDVAGAVVTPGVYRLASGARIGDAITAAGGFGPRVDVDRVGVELNLAATLTDGAQIRVPSRDDPSPSAGGTGTGRSGTGGAGTGGGSGGPLNLNTATQSDLEALPGIGPVTAGKILESRAGAPFRTVDELRERGLVGEKTFEKLKPLITVG
jgi:competence protein ComEA